MSKWSRCTLLLLVTAVSISVATDAHAAAVGALLGFGREGISGDAPPNTTYWGAIGGIAGLQGEIALTDGIALSVQPMFSQRRTTLTTATFSGETNHDLKLDYVSVPIVLKFSAAHGRTYVTGGVDLGFLQSAKITGNGLDEDIKDGFHSTDLGALVGFGVVFPIGGPNLTTEIRYVQGLTDLSKDSASAVDPAASPDLPDRFHSGGLQVTAGILFPIGKR